MYIAWEICKGQVYIRGFQVVGALLKFWARIEATQLDNLYINTPINPINCVFFLFQLRKLQTTVNTRNSALIMKYTLKWVLNLWVILKQI